MQNDLYEIGDLKNDPERLYNMAIQFDQFFQCRTPDQNAEIWDVLERVSNSLWGSLPPVLVVDFRDPDDPGTWGTCGAPPGFVLSDSFNPGPLF